MKILEDVERNGGSITTAIKNMINDMFNKDIEEDDVEEIAGNLKLSELLALDKAYTDGDRERVQDILGPLPQLEYSMGQGRKPASAASSRPAPATKSAPAAQAGGDKKSTKGSNYSGGMQNAGAPEVDAAEPVVDDPDAVMQDPEGDEMDIKESDKYQYNRNDEIIVTSGEWEGEIGTVVGTSRYLVTVELRHYEHTLDFEPDEISLNDEHIDESKTKANVVRMTEWLQRRAGIK